MLREAFAFCAALVVSGGCARNPATGVAEIMLVDEGLEIAMGRDADRDVTARLGLLEDPELAAYVSSVGAALASASERPALPWRFRVLDDAGVNAFALPGGFVYVTRGLLAHLNSEAELAAVLGHEIGHVAARHSARRTSETRAAVLGLGIATLVEPRVGRNLDLAQVGLGLLMLELGRMDELAADELALRYVRRTGYEAAAVVRVLEMLGRVEGDAPSPVSGWTSTHPASAERIARARAAARGLQGRRSNLPFVRRLDGMLFGDDPRTGARRHDAFVHPLLDLAIEIPPGWLTRSDHASLVAVSPEGDAALAVRPAPQTSARSAALAFGASRGVRAGAASQQRDVWIRDFEHEGPDGDRYRGVAWFEERDGFVLRLMAYSRETVFEECRGALVAALASASRTAGSPLPAPARIQVLETGPLRLHEFVATYPSVVPEHTVALLNGLDPADPTAVVPQPAKRVVRGEEAGQ